MCEGLYNFSHLLFLLFLVLFLAFTALAIVFSCQSDTVVKLHHPRHIVRHLVRITPAHRNLRGVGGEKGRRMKRVGASHKRVGASQIKI